MVKRYSNVSRIATARQAAAPRYALQWIAPLLVSVVFILAACFLIIFAPPDRAQAIIIVAIGLLIVGVGLAGFGVLRLKLPGMDLALNRDEPAAMGPTPPPTAKAEHDK